ncbi:hypothetical protein BA190_09230 [Labrys sp. WJW]|uniref:DUF4031 domain-containing protein n=1 Tax=Labrys sp. WJW TaxID=1737983 RepID=UPI0008372EBC|nr:DUF4031 domain-containing protein [Labrys sp. WJW]OCC05087.1 hypothetical protein BA190_09230 [Labrys sp. WJW]
MTVYVDDMHKVPLGQFRRMKMSHMIADTEEELHAMARKIGVARKWYQGDHYDIAMSKRALAVAAGAVEIPMRTLAFMANNRRSGYPMGTPETARAIAMERMAVVRGKRESDRAGWHSPESNLVGATWRMFDETYEGTTLPKAELRTDAGELVAYVLDAGYACYPHARQPETGEDVRGGAFIDRAAALLWARKTAGVKSSDDEAPPCST